MHEEQFSFPMGDGFRGKRLQGGGCDHTYYNSLKATFGIQNDITIWGQ
jgi:hypothetical protein